jgi:hypothetical protein
MIKTIIFCFTVASIAITSCTSNKQPAQEDHSMMNHDSTTTMQENTMVDENVKMVPTTFTTVDAGVSTTIKSMLNNYLEIKNALVEGNAEKAATSSKSILSGMKGLDKSLLTAEQKKVYDDVESDLKEHAEHISKNELDHQREHFIMMSTDMYDLVKAFGAGMTVYHEYCPMANDNKGAMWLSESKEIRNPYFGDKMMTCGSVEEMFQ